MCGAGARDSEWRRAQLAKLAELEERSAREAATAARRVAQLEEEAADLRRCDADALYQNDLTASIVTKSRLCDSSTT